MSQAQRCTCPSIPGICWEQPGHFSPLHIPGFCDPAGHSRIPVMLVTTPPPKPIEDLTPFSKPYKELGNSAGFAVPQGGGLGFSCLAQHSSHGGGGRGTVGWPQVTTSPPDVPSCMDPCLGNPSPSFPRFDGSIPFPPSPPSTPQPRPRTWIGTGINFSARFGCWWF